MNDPSLAVSVIILSISRGYKRGTRPLYRSVFVAPVLLCAVACAPLGDTPGASPRSVAITLTSEVNTEPLTNEELANPAVQELIKQCERQTGDVENCAVRVVPVDNLHIFDHSIHDQIITVVETSGLQTNRKYSVEGKLFNPQGEQISRYTVDTVTPTQWPPFYALTYSFHWGQLPAESGTWRIGIHINGQLETERSFEVVGPASDSNLFNDSPRRQLSFGGV